MTVKSHFLASAGCANFPKFVNNSNIEPEVEFRPEIEFLPEVEIPAETDEEGSGATRHIPDIASQYIPEVAITQEVTTSASITTSTLPIPRNPQPHTRLKAETTFKRQSVCFVGAKIAN